MKKRTAFIGALVSLLPIAQPLLIGTGTALTSAAVILAAPEKVQAETAKFYLIRGINKHKSKDYYRAISDFNKVIQIDFKNFSAYEFLSFSKISLKDYAGALADMNKAIQLNPNHPDVLNGTAFASRGWAKHYSGDFRGSCSDWRKALSLGREDALKWIKSSYGQC